MGRRGWGGGVPGKCFSPETDNEYNSGIPGNCSDLVLPIGT